MTTFYDSDTVYITDQWFRVGNHEYAVSQLHNLRVARGQRDPLVRRAAITAGVALPAVLFSGHYLPHWLTVAASTLTLLAPTVTAAVRARLRPPDYLLWADYRGSVVQLYQTRSQTEFGKVSRAVARAASRHRHRLAGRSTC